MRSWEQIEGETLTDFPLWRGIVIKAPQVFMTRTMITIMTLLMMMIMMIMYLA